MKKHNLLKRLAAAAFVGLSVLTLSTVSADAAKTKIADVSQWQGSINWSKASKELKMVIIRVKHGNPGDADYSLDSKRTVNANGAYKYGIPFGQYNFAEFDSVADAQKDAKQFYQLADKRAKFYVLDNEKRKSGVKGKEQTYVNAWLKTMRSLTDKKIIYYSYQTSFMFTTSTLPASTALGLRTTQLSQTSQLTYGNTPGMAEFLESVVTST
ncbi:GH25 family lysozyme [Secundilactobacillus oryzae]|uniref:GH25 family lysozyme n=1 Tax=Secundilactobacillus oryzae TaxID=1202668 RepID=UPI000A774BD7